jgi:micrococcal nuclease
MTKTKSPILTLIALLILLIFSYFNSNEIENGQVDLTSQTNQTSEQSEKALVVKIVDGDTVDVQIPGQIDTERIRIIGINTPEKDQCYFNEANEKATTLLKDQEILLEKDDSQGDKDKYGRTLSHILINDTNYGEIMIKEGFAKEYTYNKPYKYQSVFKEAQDFAMENDLGIWSIVCEK